MTVYAPPYTEPPKLSITLDYFGDGAIAVSRQGTVAVAGCTIASGSQCNPGVLFYAAGSTTPCTTICLDPAAFANFGGAGFDRKGNLYVASRGNGTAPLTLGKIDGGCKAQKAKTFTAPDSIAYSGSLQVDKAGRIAIDVALGTYPYTIAIETYAPPKNGTLGDPVSTTPLPVYTSSAAFAFRGSGRSLWTGYNGGAYEIAYPAGGAPEKIIIGPPSTYTFGVAVTPVLVP